MQDLTINTVQVCLNFMLTIKMQLMKGAIVLPLAFSSVQG